MLSKKAVFTGTQIAYSVICPTKLWYFTNNIRLEKESELVAVGKSIHESTFQRAKKDITIDNKISLDIIKNNDGLLIREVKKSKKLERAHLYQLLYYIYYLQEKGIEKISGEITYPTEREVKKVELTEGNKKELEDIILETGNIVKLPLPPQAVKKPYCKNCSYFQFCWVD